MAVSHESVAAESIVLDYWKLGPPNPKAFAEARNAMLDAIAALSRKVRFRIAMRRATVGDY
jgi:hypothetical protein